VPSPLIPQLPEASISSTSLPTSPEATSATFSPTSASTAQSPHPAPFKLAQRSTLTADDAATSDTHSIKSSRSLSSSVSATAKHPDAITPGLNASIIETSSAWFSTDGTVTRAVQIGEVALAYNPTESEDKQSDESTIRFEGFGSLEKVAPNPNFIQPLLEKGEGVYAVNLAKISGHGKMAVAFKYQVHLDATSSASSHVPLIVSMASKVESGQTLVKVTYGLNPSFKFSTAESVHLSAVTIILHMDPTGGKILQCQASNGGTYSRERNLVYWSLNDVTLPLVETEGQPLTQGLLLRFATEGEVKTGNVEAKWEILGERLPGSGGIGVGLSKLVESSTGPNTEVDTDPFADDDAPSTDKASEWNAVHEVRKLKSGTYLVNVA
jgi:F-BAR domain only protein